MMNREVRRIMTTNPSVVSTTTTVAELFARMSTENTQQMPVITTAGKLVGMVQYAKVAQLMHAGVDTTEITAEDIMDRSILRLAPKDKVGTAAELLADVRFKVLPVVNLRNELKGVVTAFNLVKVAFNREYKNPILYTEAFG